MRREVRKSILCTGHSDVGSSNNVTICMLLLCDFVRDRKLLVSSVSERTLP